jgi:REP element-mobilizing transposase RayT
VKSENCSQIPGISDRASYISSSEIEQIMKSISAREVFKKFPKLRKLLWAGELWNDGYFVRSVGDEVTADIIRKYIEFQTQEDSSIRLNMFGGP